jgi:hypothetical protein
MDYHCFVNVADGIEIRNFELNFPNDFVPCVSLLTPFSRLEVGSSGHVSRTVCQ